MLVNFLILQYLPELEDVDPNKLPVAEGVPNKDFAAVPEVNPKRCLVSKPRSKRTKEA